MVVEGLGHWEHEIVQSGDFGRQNRNQAAQAWLVLPQLG